ncbi:MAG: hypothetical protein ACE5DR_02340, partial [Thermodesulfobacteriota bacterium]
MEKETSGSGGGRRSLRKAAAVLFLFILVFLLSAYLFLNSSYCTALLTRAGERVLGRPVEIQSLSAGPLEGVTLRGLAIGRGRERLARIEALRIRLTPKTLLKGRAVSLYITEPEIFYSSLKETAIGDKTKGQNGAGTGSKSMRRDGVIEPPSIPWFIKDITVSGLVLRRSHEARSTAPAIIGPLGLTFSVRPDKNAALSVNTYLPPLKTSASINVELDTGKLSLLRGDLELGMIELKDLKAGGVSIIAGESGTISAGIGLRQDKDGIEASLTAKFKDISLQNFSTSGPASGTLRGILTLDSALSRADMKARLFINEQETGKGERSLGEMKASYEVQEGVLKITEAALTFPSPTSGSIHARGELSGVPGPKPVLDIELRAEKLQLAILNEALPAPLSIKIIAAESGEGLSGSLSIRGALRERLRLETTLRLHDSISYGPYVMSLKEHPLLINSEGSYSIKDETLRIEVLRAGAASIGSLFMNGTISGPLRDYPVMELNLHGRGLKLAAIKKSIAAPEPLGLEAEGSAEADIFIKGSTRRPVISGNVSMKDIYLEGYGLTLEKMEAGLGLDYENSRLTMKGIKAHMDTLRFTAKEGPLTSLRKVALQIPVLTLDEDTLIAGDFDITIEKALLPAGKDPLFERDTINLSGNLRCELRKNRFTAEKLTFSAGPKGGISGKIPALRLDLNEPVTAEARVEIKNQPVEAFAVSLLERAGLRPKIELSGMMDAGLSAKVLDWSQVSAGVSLSLRDGAFSAGDGNIAAEGVKVLAAGDLNVDLKRQKADFSIEAGGRDFQLLVKSFYGDFTDRPLKVRVHGGYDGEKDTLKIPSIDIELKPIGSLKGTALVSSLSTTARLRGALAPLNISNKEFFDFFIAPTFSEALPVLNGLELAGSTRLGLKIDGTSEDFSIKGLLEVREGGIKEKGEEAGGGSLLVQGVDLTLPVELGYPRAEAGIIKEFGSLGVERVVLGPVELAGFKAAPAIGGNALSFSRDMEIPLFGGIVTAHDVVFADLLSPKRTLGLRVSVAAIDLGKAGAALGLPPLDGTLSGHIPGMRLAGDRLTTEGEMRLSLFGGLVVIKEMSMDNVFSPVTALKSSIEISELDLGSLTSTFEFGKITGVLQGR